MALATIFEESEPVVSPNGRYSVVVSSQNSGPKRSLSQAYVSHSNGGSGLIAFYEARVPMSFMWRTDDELVVRYPDDLPAPCIDATNTSYGLGGGGRVVYEPVPREQIAVAKLVAAAKRDETLLLLALEHARREGELE
jgi:hypothetical protein